MKMRDIKKIVIHCSYSRPTQDWGASHIRRIHVEENGWDDIGYHFVIRRDGVVEGGRPLEEEGAHAKGHNEDSIGICLIGGMSKDHQPDANFTSAQYTALATLITAMSAAFSLTRNDIYGHRDLAPDRECPCFDTYEFAGGLF